MTTIVLITTILCVLIAAFFAWIGSQTYSHGKAISVIQTNQKHLTTKVELLEAKAEIIDEIRKLEK